MIRVVYVEEEVREHPRTKEVLSRLPRAQRIACQRYGEIFNRRRQSFRLQKASPSLILAKKHRGHVLPAPDGYGIGGVRNFYFSHLLNCPYDCRYCFLQGMYRSAHYVLFVDYEDFENAIDDVLAAAAGADDSGPRDGGREAWFFSGYDCDSLAFENVTGFARRFLDFFACRPAARLELRTKSVQIDTLREREPLENVVVAYSLSPEGVAAGLEHRAPSPSRRLQALAELQRLGWPIGLRFDPLIQHRGAVESYRRLFRQVFERLSLDGLHSVSLGNFRLPVSFHRRLTRLYPEEPLFALPTATRDGIVSYPESSGRELFEECREALLEHVPADRYYPCLSP